MQNDWKRMLMLNFVLKYKWILIIGGLFAYILVLKLDLSITENKLIETQSNLDKALEVNSSMVKQIETLKNDYKNALIALNNANAEKAKLQGDLNDVKNYVNNSEDSTINLFNNAIDRMWGDANNKTPN